MVAVESEVALDVKTFDRRNLHVCASEETGSLDITLVSTIYLVEERVAVSVVEITWLLDDVTLGIVWMSDGGHLQGEVIHTVVTLVIVLVGIRDGRSYLHHLVDFVVDVDTSGVTLKLVVLHHTVVVHH